MNTIVTIEFGSHLYGTSTPESDQDFRSVHIPDSYDILMQRVADSVMVDSRVKSEGEKNLPGEMDNKSYSLQAFMRLLSEGQTEALDMIFAPANKLVKRSWQWDQIVYYRSKFLTKRSAAFVGYCRKQANKYGIKGSRVDAAKKASEFFTEMMDTFGATVKVGEILVAVDYGTMDDHTKYVTKETTPGHKETYFECCNRMVGFKNTVKEAAKIYTAIYNEYGARARAAADNQGIDWKALSHAVRVGHQALELLRTGNITFPLHNAEHLLSIKRGKLPYVQVAEEIESLLVEVEEAAASSTLPDQANQQLMDQLVLDYHASTVLKAYEGFTT